MGSSCFLIHLNGLVQGVGFRPFVFRMATEWGLSGTVGNGSNGVEIILNTSETIAQQFLRTIIQQPPPLAHITHSNVQRIDYQHFQDFKIIESTTSEKATLLLSPDFAMCATCRTELHDPQNRRFRYSFITCTQCGPRYSITQSLPYDRPNTTMRPFEMCAACGAEYETPTDRRFYSQTNSCPDCGPQLGWYKSENNESRRVSYLHDSRWILPRVKLALETGKIVAVKSTGGYLILCDATNEQAVQTLRQRKHRPTKPFALLFPNLQILRNQAFVSEQEAEMLRSVEAPIVLVKAKFSNFEAVFPKLSYLGVMLPHTPLLDLIANDFGKPLVATSGNISGNPIVYEDQKALAELGQVADYILTNNRQILVPQDDSVVRFTEKHQQKIIIRRSRGGLLTPNGRAIISPRGESRLAFGASLKSTLALQTPDNLYVSQYLGDLESYETQENFRTTLNHFLQLFGLVRPQMLLCDAHEGYFSTQLAQELASEWQIPVHKIQHHAAHLAAVLAENDLLESKDPILGVIWDGTGYGTDGHIWGGEFLNSKSKNRLHFPYFDAILGDKMPREPRLSALSLAKTFSKNTDLINLLKPKFSAQEWTYFQKVLASNTLKTSSIGRLFDGVSSILGLCDQVSYEGEAALRLEDLTAQYVSQNGYSFSVSYFEGMNFVIDDLLADLQNQKPAPWIAAKFHFSLVQLIKHVANDFKISKLAFSGGVFQNAVLINFIIEHLDKDFQLYFHQQLSPNDECISFGQMARNSVVIS